MDTFLTQVSWLAFTVCLKHIDPKSHFILAFKWCAHTLFLTARHLHVKVKI